MINHYLPYMIMGLITLHITLFIIGSPKINFEFVTGAIICFLAGCIVSFIILVLIEGMTDLYFNY